MKLICTVVNSVLIIAANDKECQKSLKSLMQALDTKTGKTKAKNMQN